MIRPRVAGNTPLDPVALPYDPPMSSTPRYLTKSRFKLALECPTKLF